MSVMIPNPQGRTFMSPRMEQSRGVASQMADSKFVIRKEKILLKNVFRDGNK